MAATNVTICLNEELKSQLQELVSNLGMDMTTFFTLSAKQAIREQRIPFDIILRVPNSKIMEAVEEVRMMKKNPSIGKTYTDVDDMMKELLG